MAHTRRDEVKGPDFYFKIWKKKRLQLAREKQHHEFLKDCREYNIVPKFLRIKNKYIEQFFRRELFKFEKHMLNLAIRKRFGLIKRLENEEECKHLDLINNTSETELISYVERVKYYEEMQNNIMCNRHFKKLRFWGKNKRQYEYRINYVPYLNLSDRVFDKHQDALLGLGPKYILENNINIKDSIPKIENVINNLPSTERNGMRHMIQKKIKEKIKMPLVNKEDRNVLKKIKEDGNIACIKTDKTGKIAILNRSDYVKKMKDIIQEIQAVKYVNKRKKKLINILEDEVVLLKRSGKWPDDKPNIINHAPIIPRLFGSLKDHKPDMKLRPIVNRREGPTYMLEKYMKKIYVELLDPTEHSIKSTRDLIDKLKDTKLEVGQTLISYDIKNMYPSVDINEMRDKLNKRIERFYNDSAIRTTLMSANNIICNDSFFSFDNVIYVQQKGLPMGSPVSGVIAEHKIREIEQIIFQKFRDNIKMWVRYVDDVLAIIDKVDGEEMLLYMNSIDKNIQFTYEKEDTMGINFLDVRIIRDNDVECGFKTSVFRKVSKSDEIIGRGCKTPFAHKLAAIRSYINRAIMICSDSKLLNEEIEVIKRTVEKAGYQRKLVDRLYERRLNRLDTIDNAQKPERKFTPTVNYDRGVGEFIAMKAAEYNKIVPIKPSPNIFQLIRSDKDKVDHLDTAGVYRIDYRFEDYEGKGCYIGQTERKLRERMKEHEKDCTSLQDKTALARLRKREDIKIDFGDMRRLAAFENRNYAKYREALEIMTEESACNSMEHAHVDISWNSFLKVAHARKKEEVAPKSESDSGSENN